MPQLTSSFHSTCWDLNGSELYCHGHHHNRYPVVHSAMFTNSSDMRQCMARGFPILPLFPPGDWTQLYFPLLHGTEFGSSSCLENDPWIKPISCLQKYRCALAGVRVTSRWCDFKQDTTYFSALLDNCYKNTCAFNTLQAVPYIPWITTICFHECKFYDYCTVHNWILNTGVTLL